MNKRQLACSFILSASVLVGFPATAQFSVTKTVGTVPGTCANTTAIQVPVGTVVTYCYAVFNDLVEDATYDLADDQLGTIATNATASGDTDDATVILRDVLITHSVTNVGTWTITPGDVEKPSKSKGLASPKPQDILTASATVTAIGAVEIPSLSDIGLVALGLGLAIAGAVALRSRLA